MPKASHTPNMPTKMTPTSQRVAATPKGNSKVMRPLPKKGAGKSAGGKNAGVRGATHVNSKASSQTVNGAPRRS